MNYNYFKSLVLIFLVVIFIPIVGMAQQENPESKPTNPQTITLKQLVIDGTQLLIEKLWEKQANSRRKQRDDNSPCPKLSKPTFNPYNVTFRDINTSSCSIFPLIDIANDTASPRFAQSEKEYSSIRKFDNADQLVVLLYVLNGADPNLDGNITAAKGVKITTSITNNGNIYKFTATATGDNISPVTGSVTVQTNSGEYLEVVPHSGFVYSYDGKIIRDSAGLEIGNSILNLGHLDSGSQYSLFFSYKVRVMKKQR